YNLGYSRINSDGQVLIDYAPLTPQTGDSSCGGADIIADDSNDLYISYMLRLSNVFYQRVRKFNQNLDTIWDYTMVDNQLAGALIGNGDIGQDYLGNIVCVFVNNGIGLDAQRMRATYSTNGEELIPAETIIEEEVLFGDLALRADGVAVFSFTWSEDSYDPGNEVYYCWVEDELSVVSEVSEVLPRELSISVYPNPVNSRANISIINPQGVDVHVQLIDPLGRIVHDYGEFFLQGRKELLLGKGLSSGVYYLSVSSGSGTTPTTEIFKPIVMLK
ncbi:T9SS type A sorting domain-containing protein, partial [bacterium]|nr:T9SS type A sorting domain-containing protein [bacterium]